MNTTDQERERLAALFDIAPSRVLHAVAELGIPDLIGHDGTTAQALAGELGLDHQRLVRLLQAAEALGVLTVQSPGAVRLLPAGTLLRTDHPASLRAEFRDNTLFTGWSAFEQCLRTGTPSYELTHGAGIFTRIGDCPEELLQFHEHMYLRAQQLYRPLLPYLSQRCAHDVVDLGGGIGGLAFLLLDASTTVRVTLTDLPEVIALIPDTARTAYRDRLLLNAGDMFSDIPAGHGTYILGSILHDWPDHRAAELLTRCSRALPPHGEIILLERVLADSGADLRRLSDMWMMAMTGGRERSRAEWAELAAEAGLELREIHCDSGELSAVILGWPARGATLPLKETAR